MKRSFSRSDFVRWGRQGQRDRKTRGGPSHEQAVRAGKLSWKNRRKRERV